MARTFTQVAPDSTGDKIAAQDFVDGSDTVLRQEVLLAGTSLAAIAAVANTQPGVSDYGLAVRKAGDGLVLLNAAAVSSATTLATQDALGYAWLAIQLTGTFTFTLAVEQSSDNANWQQIFGIPLGVSIPSTTTASLTTAGQWWFPVKARHVRVRCSSFTSSTSGAVTAVLKNTAPPPVEYHSVVIQSASVALPVQPQGASGSLVFTSARVASAASTNATSVKASAGNLYGGFLSNTSASAKFFKFHNKASAPTVGTDTPIWTMLLPAGQTISLNQNMAPLRFATGIAYAITGAVADSDTTAVAANDVHGVLIYV